MEVPIHYLAVLVCAAINMVVGFAWYSQSLFGKPWMRLAGITQAQMEAGKKKGMMQSMVLGIVFALLMAYVLAHATVFGIAYTKIGGYTGGLMSGFWNWLGFIFPVTAGAALWEGKPWKLVAINSGYYLVVLLVNGMILASWV